MSEKIMYACVPLQASVIARLKEVCDTNVTKEALYDAIEFRIKAGKKKREV